MTITKPTVPAKWHCVNINRPVGINLVSICIETVVIVAYIKWIMSSEYDKL